MLTKTRNHQTGSAHIVLIVGAVLLLVTAIGWFTYNKLQYTQKVNKERALYAAADKEAKAYIDAIAEKYPGEVKSYSYCDYTSEIYSKGTLGCSIDATLIVSLVDKNKEDVLTYANGLQSQLAWKFVYDNTDPNLVGSENTIQNRVYRKDSITCGIQYYYQRINNNSDKIDKNKIEIDAGCSGNALAEYYSVVEH